MSIPIKAVIFDMDGVLIDSEPYWKKADAEFFVKHNKKHTSEINKKIMGMGQREIIEYFKKRYGFIGDTYVLISERREILYKQLLPKIKLMTGVKKLIDKIHQKKLALAVATSGHSVEKTVEILKKLRINSYFKTIVSGDDVLYGKPAPDIYLRSGEKLSIEPKNCLVIEDAPSGVKAGKAAGMMVYGVNADEKMRKLLAEAGADKVFSSLIEIKI